MDAFITRTTLTAPNARPESWIPELAAWSWSAISMILIANELWIPCGFEPVDSIDICSLSELDISSGAI